MYIGSIVKCVKSKDAQITLNKEYEVIAAHKWRIAVMNDRDLPQFYGEDRFKVVKPGRDPDLARSMWGVTWRALDVLVEAVEVGDTSTVIASTKAVRDFARFE